MTNPHPSSLSDAALLAATLRAAAVERRATADLLALLAELDARKLYLGQGYPSLFAYCTRVLQLSEPAAYARITAARSASRHPVILTLMNEGDVTLTTISLLAAHLTDENHEALLEAARHKSKRDVERLVASVDPQPDVPSTVRRLPTATAPAHDTASGAEVPRMPNAAKIPVQASPLLLSPPSDFRPVEPPARPNPRAVVAPLAAERYFLKVTLTSESHSRLMRLRDLLRHQIPSGDPAAIVDRALTALLEQLERSKLGATRRPRQTAGHEGSRKAPAAVPRHVPAAVKRAVWARDAGQCAFIGTDGRCPETGFLEFHHVAPFARGGPTTVANLQLRCRAHNAHQAELEFGRSRVGAVRSLACASCVI